MQTILYQLSRANCKLGYSQNCIFLKSKKEIYPLHLKTTPYPGFPTDMQSQFVTLLSIAKGTSIVVENIFENRFKYVSELSKMGAHITIDKKAALISGVPCLTSATVEAKDLRGGASLVAAALMANGVSTVVGTQYIKRGYENFIEKLTILGAKIHEE